MLVVLKGALLGPLTVDPWAALKAALMVLLTAVLKDGHWVGLMVSQRAECLVAMTAESTGAHLVVRTALMLAA